MKTSCLVPLTDCDTLTKSRWKWHVHASYCTYVIRYQLLAHAKRMYVYLIFPPTFFSSQLPLSGSNALVENLWNNCLCKYKS